MTSRAFLTPPRLAVPLATALLLQACGGAQVRDPFTGEGPGGRGGRVSIEVQNLNFNDATVYVLRNGQESRIGRVTGKTDQRYSLEWNFAVPIRFFIDLVGGRQCRTAQLQVDPGDDIRVQIPSNIGATPCMVIKR